MSKINLKIVGIIICILIAAVLFKDVILVNNSPKKVVMEYVTAIANKDYDKLYELSHIEDFCSDKTFLDKETFINYCKEQYDDYTFAQDKLKEYMTGVKSDEKLDNEVGDFKIEDIVYGDKRQDATVTVYSLKYDKSESIYVQKIDDKWIIDDLANLIIKDYKLKVPKYLSPTKSNFLQGTTMIPYAKASALLTNNPGKSSLSVKGNLNSGKSLIESPMSDISNLPDSPIKNNMFSCTIK